jgi:tellurite resistance protein TehA-like permease
VPPWIRLLCALAAFPAGWAVRQAASPAAGGIVVLVLIAVCAAGLPAARAAAVVGLGIACFVLVHLVGAVTAAGVGLAVGAAVFALVGSRLWRAASSSSARPGTPAI